MGLRVSIILSALQQYGRQAIFFLASVVIARLLTPQEMGVFAVSMGVIGLLDMLRTMGVPAYFVTLHDLSKQDIRTYNGIVWSLGGVFTTLLFAISWPVATFYGNPLVGECLRILAVGHLITPFGSAGLLLLNRNMRFGALLWIGLAASATQASVAIGLASIGVGPLSLAWAQMASNSVMALGGVLCESSVAGLLPSFKGWSKPFHFGGWLTATTISGSVGMQAAELITGRILGLASSALYSRAMGMTNMIRSLSYAAVVQPALPAFAQAERTEQGGMARIYLQLVAVITGLGWPAYAALAVWSEPLTLALYGEQWRESAALVPAICLYGAMTFAVTPYHEAMIAQGRVRLFLRCETGVALGWPACLMVASAHGLQAVALATALGGSGSAVVYAIVLRRVLRYRLRDLATVWFKSGVLTVAVGTTALLVRYSPVTVSWSLPVALAFNIFIGGLAWAAAIWLVGHEFREHIAEIIQWGWSRLRFFGRPVER